MLKNYTLDDALDRAISNVSSSCCDSFTLPCGEEREIDDEDSLIACCACEYKEGIYSNHILDVEQEFEDEVKELDIDEIYELLEYDYDDDEQANMMFDGTYNESDLEDIVSDYFEQYFYDKLEDYIDDYPDDFTECDEEDDDEEEDDEDEEDEEDEEFSETDNTYINNPEFRQFLSNFIFIGDFVLGKTTEDELESFGCDINRSYSDYNDTRYRNITLYDHKKTGIYDSIFLIPGNFGCKNESDFILERTNLSGKKKFKEWIDHFNKIGFKASEVIGFTRLTPNTGINNKYSFSGSVRAENKSMNITMSITLRSYDCTSGKDLNPMVEIGYMNVSVMNINKTCPFHDWNKDIKNTSKGNTSNLQVKRLNNSDAIEVVKLLKHPLGISDYILPDMSLYDFKEFFDTYTIKLPWSTKTDDNILSAQFFRNEISLLGEDNIISYFSYREDLGFPKEPEMIYNFEIDKNKSYASEDSAKYLMLRLVDALNDIGFSMRKWTIPIDSYIMNYIGEAGRYSITLELVKYVHYQISITIVVKREGKDIFKTDFANL